jgi:transposase-like protein
VKHDDPEDVDQKEFNDQDRSPKNLLNPNIQDSGASGEDAVRNKMDKPTQDGGAPWHPESDTFKRFEMLLPLIEHYYHSDEPGTNDPMLRELHEMMEAERPGYLNDADHDAAERFFQNRKQQPVAKVAFPYARDHGDMRSGEDRRQEERRQWTDEDEAQHLQERAYRAQNPGMLAPSEFERVNRRIQEEDRRQGERRQQPLSITCPECQRGEMVGSACNNCGATMEQILSKPTSREAYFKQREAVMNPMQQGNQVQNQLALDPSGADPKARGVLPPGPGGTRIAPQKRVFPQEIPTPDEVVNPEQPPQEDPNAQGSLPPNVKASHTDILAALIEGANHQGPVTPEQVASVQQWLIQHGRVNEVPNVELDPGNPEYVKILKEIQGENNVPPTVTPEEQTKVQPPQMPPGAMPGAMPVPGMAPGEAGGQPMQPMSSFHPDDLWSAARTAADNIAPRCPACGSGTTGMIGDEDGHARCHACKHVFKVPNVIDDNATGQTSISHRQALRGEPKHLDQANPVGVPASEQEAPENQGGDQDSSLVWKDKNGDRLVAGQTYEMHNPAYTLPDLVRVERVKPDGIDVTLLGTYANDPTTEDPNRLTSSTPISKEDMELQELTFEPAAQSQEDRGNEPPPGEQAPGLPPVRPTTDEQTAREPAMAHVEDPLPGDELCPKCGSFEHTSSMISAEATEHDCYYCGHVWVTEEKTAGPHMEDGEWVNPTAQWLLEDDDAEDFSPRQRGMMEASQQSKNIRDLAANDPRRQAIREYLMKEGRERKERVAGRHFTPREQRELIDERGNARNSDLLDLEGTHYKVRESWDSNAKPERVRDNDLFLGI